MTVEEFEYLCNHPEIAEWSYDEWFEQQENNKSVGGVKDSAGGRERTSNGLEG